MRGAASLWRQMTGWLRRNWIPTVGMVVAVAFVSWLGWINVRGGSGKGAVAPTASASASASPVGPSATPPATADPAVAQVEATAKAWIRAYYDSYRTADASVLISMVEPGSQAAGDAGTPRAFVLRLQRTEVVTQLTIDPITPAVVGDSATADVHYTTVSVPSAWPSLKPTGASETRAWVSHIEMIRIGGRWLVDSFT